MSVKEIALKNALHILKALNCQFLVITSDGHEYGDLIAATPNRKRGKSPLPIGTYSKHFRPYIDNLKVGDVAAVPIGSFIPGELQSNMCSRAAVLWGTGSYTTHVSNDNVEILRIK